MHTLPRILESYFEGLKARDVDRIAAAVADDVAFIAKTRVLAKAEFLEMLRALYIGFPDWHYDFGPPEFRGEVIAVKIRQGGCHTGTLAFPGMEPIAATGKRVLIPEHFFFYRLRNGRLVEIRPEPVPGGAPFGILEQLGLPMPS